MFSNAFYQYFDKKEKVTHGTDHRHRRDIATDLVKNQKIVKNMSIT